MEEIALKAVLRSGVIGWSICKTLARWQFRYSAPVLLQGRPRASLFAGGPHYSPINSFGVALGISLTSALFKSYGGL